MRQNVAIVHAGIMYGIKGKKNYSEAFNIIEVRLDVQHDFDMLPGISAPVTEGQELIWSGAF